MPVLSYRVCVILVLACTLIGCSKKGGEVNPDNRWIEPDGDNGDDRWPAWYPHAVDVRVHPASRYVMERDELRLEARIELIDQLSEPIKDVGLLTVELRLLDGKGRIVTDELGRQRGFRWEFDLTTQERQAQLWDPIARAYILQLKIDNQDADLPRYRTVLRVTFDPAWPGLPTLPKEKSKRQPVEIRTDW